MTKSDPIKGVIVDAKSIKDPSSGKQALGQRFTPELVHLDNGHGKSKCGVRVAGIMIVERTNRVTCGVCLGK